MLNWKNQYLNRFVYTIYRKEKPSSGIYLFVSDVIYIYKLHSINRSKKELLRETCIICIIVQ